MGEVRTATLKEKLRYSLELPPYPKLITSEFTYQSGFLVQKFEIYTMLIFPIQCVSESFTEIKIKLNIYFHTSWWCLKRFVHKTYWDTSKKCENKNLT